MKQVSFRMEDDLFRDVHIAAAAQGLKVGEVPDVAGIFMGR